MTVVKATLAGMPDRPVIGLCLTQTRARYGPWDMECVLLPRDYVRAVQRAEALALLLAPDPFTTEHPDEVLDRIDGLVLAGGVDVGDDPERDAYEIALGTRALERDLPLLGVCRGMQVMNVAAGGTLIQHVPDVVGHEEHRHTEGHWTDHDVRLSDGSLAARAAGATTTAVKSHHHQAVDRVADTFTITGWADEDDLPEAFESPSHAFALGVQWHPEADEESRLIAALVDEARSRAVRT
jgi:putative glutamine amidotransferase